MTEKKTSKKTVKKIVVPANKTDAVEEAIRSGAKTGELAFEAVYSALYQYYILVTKLPGFDDMLKALVVNSYSSFKPICTRIIGLKRIELAEINCVKMLEQMIKDDESKSKLAQYLTLLLKGKDEPPKPEPPKPDVPSIIK